MVLDGKWVVWGGKMVFWGRYDYIPKGTFLS